MVIKSKRYKKVGTSLAWIDQAIILERLQSRGGRPSDPQWAIKRLIPFKRKTWEMLLKLSETMSMDKKKISPAQLAAALIEQHLNCMGI